MIDRRSEVYVLGGGGHAKVVVRALQDLGYHVAAVFDDDPRKRGASLAGVPIVGPIQEIENHPRRPAVLAIGSNAARQALAARLDLDWVTVVHPAAFVDRTVRIGRGSVVLAGAILQADAVVGDHVTITTGASVDHDCVIGDYALVAAGARVAGGVQLEEGVFLGAGAVVIPCRRVGAWTTVGAGGVVIDDLPPFSKAMGVPARPQSRSGAPAQAPAAVSACEASGNGARPGATSPSAPAKERAPAASPRIFLSPPHMGPDERELLLEAFDSNWIAYLGPQVDAFEREFAEKLGVKEAVAVTSGTAALHLALLSLRIGPGDEVATSSFTFAASANVIRYVGATPVFIDCERQSWNLDPQLLAEELESGAARGRPLKAVLAVDVCGQCADYEHLLKVCRFYNVPLIEDAAQALGARYGGQAAGTFGEMSCFSFNGNKIITTGGGGMLVTDRTDLAERARFLSTQAREPAPHYEHAEIGYNYRLSNLLAAVGRGQLRLLEDRIARRRDNFQFYKRELGDLHGIAFMPEPAPSRASRWLTCITIDPQQFGAGAEELRLALEAENIESRRLWKPMHLQTAFAGCRVRGGAVSEQLFREGLSLPSGSNLHEDELRRVVQVIRRTAGSGAIESMPASAVDHGGPGRLR